MRLKAELCTAPSEVGHVFLGTVQAIGSSKCWPWQQHEVEVPPASAALAARFPPRSAVDTCSCLPTCCQAAVCFALEFPGLSLTHDCQISPFYFPAEGRTPDHGCQTQSHQGWAQPCCHGDIAWGHSSSALVWGGQEQPRSCGPQGHGWKWSPAAQRGQMALHSPTRGRQVCPTLWQASHGSGSSQFCLARPRSCMAVGTPKFLPIRLPRATS